MKYYITQAGFRFLIEAGTVDDKKKKKKGATDKAGQGEDDQDALYGIYLQRLLAGKMAK